MFLTKVHCLLIGWGLIFDVQTSYLLYRAGAPWIAGRIFSFNNNTNNNSNDSKNNSNKINTDNNNNDNNNNSDNNNNDNKSALDSWKDRSDSPRSTM